jgi:23S rRNA (uracil1939-C5)-methyltransferase
MLQGCMTYQDYTITKMAQLGEGVALTDNPRNPIFVPYALPDEIVRVEEGGERLRITQILTKSPDRIEPFCPYFTKCGGCSVQHWQDAPYKAWKRDLIINALSFEQLHPVIHEMIDAHGVGRRRALLHVRFIDHKPVAGFMEPKSHRVVNFDTCPILVPELKNCTHIAKELAKPLMSLRKPLSIQFTATISGLDVDIRGPGKIDFNARMNLTDLAMSHDLARLSIHGDIVIERRQPVLKFGRTPVCIPPGGFTQATTLGEETLAKLVQDAVGKATKIADLFCGAGPFALRLAETASVYAADCDPASIDALKRGFNGVQGLKQVTAEARDLFKRPLLAHELNAFDVIVLDPPRAGAEAQMREIATSKVAKVVSVSCNPASFARDAGILAAAGFTLQSVTPVDQFKYSAHVEMVGIFVR